MKGYNFKFKTQLDRTIFEETKEKAEEYMRNKYPNRIIIEIEELD